MLVNSRIIINPTLKLRIFIINIEYRIRNHNHETNRCKHNREANKHSEKGVRKKEFHNLNRRINYLPSELKLG